jgi:hypothetical protein
LKLATKDVQNDVLSCEGEKMINYSTVDRVAFDLIPEVGHLPYAFVRSIIEKHINNARMELIKVAYAESDISKKLMEKKYEQSNRSEKNQHDKNNLHTTPHEMRKHRNKKRESSCQIFKFPK